MKFGDHFEFHKIPEWYNMYLQYSKLKKMIESFKHDNKTRKTTTKLPGYFYLSSFHQLVRLTPHQTDESPVMIETKYLPLLSQVKD